MRIDQIELKNFKGFEQQKFNFAAQFNLIIGDNGSGKTALLEALAAGMTTLLLGFSALESRSSHRGIAKQDVRRLYLQEGQNTKIQYHYPVTLHFTWLQPSEASENGTLHWERSRHKAGGRTRFSHATELIDYAAKLEQNWKAHKNTIFPLLVYYNTERLGLKKWDSLPTVQPTSRFEAYKDCLAPTVSEKSVWSWIKTMQIATLQRREPLGVLEAVYAAMRHCIEGCQAVYYDIEQDELLVNIKQTLLPTYLLSHGQRNMLAMVADIAYRAAILNPHLQQAAPQQTPGIVLIDELDLHLHPTWQRKIVDMLKTTFPQLQFFATTHSPFLVQALKVGELLDLNGHQAEYVDKSIEDIAEQQMGVPLPQRSERYLHMKAAAEAYYKVLEQAKDSDSAAELKKLEQRLDALAAPFSDDVAYHTFLEMERKAALGDKT